MKHFYTEVVATPVDDGTRRSNNWSDYFFSVYLLLVLAFTLVLVVFVVIAGVADTLHPPTQSPSVSMPHYRTAAPTQSDPCLTLHFPNPQISFLYKERKSDDSYKTVHYLSLDNYMEYPDELFAAAPPGEVSCDAGKDTAYTWIEVVNKELSEAVVTYCEPLSSTPNTISFEATSPFPVYVQFKCGSGYQYKKGMSNTIEIPN